MVGGCSGGGAGSCSANSEKLNATPMQPKSGNQSTNSGMQKPPPMTDLSVPAALHASSDEEHSPNGLPGSVTISIHTPEAQARPSSFAPPKNYQTPDIKLPEEGQRSCGNSFASLMKRPDDELFHCMVSYRVNTDAARACAIHNGLHFKALNAKKKLDLFVMAKYPAGFNRPREAKKSWLNVFLDKSCLQDSKDWADEGFLKAILNSLTIIPILSWETAADGVHRGSVGQLASHNKDSSVDNVLLELVLAKELHCVLQAFAKASNQNDTLYPCMNIFPIFVQDLFAFAKLSTLSDDAPQKTLAKAAAVLESVGIHTDDAFMNQSVKSIIMYFTKLQGVKYFEYGVNDNANEQVVSRIWDLFKMQSTDFDIDRFQLDSFSENNPHGSELLQFLLASDAGYLSRFLMKHGISSVAMLGDVRLRDDAVKNLALEVSTACKRPLLAETVKIIRILNAAAESQLARPLQQRLDDFLDTDASILTAIYRSSRLVILRFRVACNWRQCNIFSAHRLSTLC
jgi:hypothetical protein